MPRQLEEKRKPMRLAFRAIYSRGKCNVKKLPQTLGLLVPQREKMYGDRKASRESSTG